ncbi:MAG: hypothetical protein H7Z43_14175 [Clostridia bacterium]|nr:hypothetical protein [Deltaproteobacteria bacterium]
MKNIGGFAMGLAFLGILFFPLALVGAVLGMYVLTMVRGPLGRYSGRNAALVAITVGIGVFATEMSMVWSYLAHRRTDNIVARQTSASDDLRALLRTQRLFRAAQDRYGSLKESHFQPRGGAYTVYLGADDYIPAIRDGQTVTDALPPGLHPKITPESFTAYAVANLDGDPELDIWSVDDTGDIKHLINDVPWVALRAVSPSGKEQNEGPAAPLVVPGAVTTEPARDRKIAKADTAEAAVAEAGKTTADAKAVPAKVEAAAIEAAKAQTGDGAEKMKNNAVKSEKTKTEGAKIDVEKVNGPKTDATKADVTPDKSKTDS